MATSSSASTVKVVIPAVNTAWKAYVQADKKIESDVRTALTSLAKVITEQTAPATQVQKSIEGTGLTAGSLGYGSIKALPVWLVLDTAYRAKKTLSKEWNALSIDKQITLATKSYSLLGKDKYPTAPAYSTLVADTTDAQAEKTRKAKASNSAKVSTGAKVEKTTDLTKTLTAIYAMIASLDPAQIEDSHIEQFNEIMAEFESKARIDA